MQMVLLPHWPFVVTTRGPVGVGITDVLVVLLEGRMTRLVVVVVVLLLVVVVVLDVVVVLVVVDEVVVNVGVGFGQPQTPGHSRVSS
mgnify:CR=1 FL=1